MKIIRIIQTAICAATVMTLAGCSRNETDSNALPEGKYPLTIASAAITAESGEQPWSASDPLSRVSETATDGKGSVWTNGDEVAVRIDGSDVVGEYKVGVDASGSVTSLTARTAVYWKDNQPHQVKGWHPCNAADGEISLSGQDKGLAYILYGQTASAVSYNTTSISLTFSHCLSKIRVKLTGSDAASVTDVKIFTCPSCTFDPAATTKVTGSGTQTFIPMRKATYGSDTYWEANVAPGSVIKDLRLNNSKDCALTTTVTTVAGSLHVINLTADGQSGVTAGEIIDLGLPSGTKWASCNLGASKPEETGDYYAWGETETNTEYSLDSYKYYSNGVYTNIGSNIGGTQYDVAHIKLGGAWRMPTSAEQKELFDNCTFMWTTINGVNGGKLTSKNNGNTIFLPAAGYRDYSEVTLAGSYCQYWSSTIWQKDEAIAIYLELYKSITAWSDTKASRVIGMPIRPVSNSQATVLPSASTGAASAVTESSAAISGSVTIGSDAHISLSYGVVFSTNQMPTSSTGDLVTSVSTSGGIFSVNVTGLNAATTYYFRSYICVDGTYYYGDVKSFSTLQIVTPGDFIDLGLPSGAKWASCNLGAAKPEESGDYYAWGETETKKDYSQSTYTHYLNGAYVNIGSDISGTKYDAAHVKMGGTWRMPTPEEQKELADNCDFEWTTLNGVQGGRFTSKNNGNSIFLPAAGEMNSTYVFNSGPQGCYWSSALDDIVNGSAIGTVFCKDYKYSIAVSPMYRGMQIRPISKVKTPSASTGLASDVTSSSAKLSGSVSGLPESYSSLSYGVVYGTSAAPTASNGKLAKYSGTSGGGFSVSLSSLDEGTTYYFRAFVCVDGTYYYGSASSFTTAESVTSGDVIDLGLSVKWASCNVGAAKPEGYGGYYAWGETETKTTYSLDNYKYYSNSTYTLLEDISGTQYDVAYAKSSGQKRMPTSAEQKELVDNCTCKMIYLNDVYGAKLTSKKNGNSIFLPAAGNKVDSEPDNSGGLGYYWSGTYRQNSYAFAYGMGFYGNSVNCDYLWDTYYGMPIRAVAK